jgi:hypothetical protein
MSKIEGLFATRTVSDISNRVNGFTGTTARNHKSSSKKICFLAIGRLDEFNDCRHLWESPLAHIISREATVIGLHDEEASFSKNVNVGDGCSVEPHLSMHRRDDNHRRGSAQNYGRQEIIGTAMRKSRDQISRRRSNDNEISASCDIDMRNILYALPEACSYRAMGKGFPRRFSDEIQRSGSWHHSDQETMVLKSTE